MKESVAWGRIVFFLMAIAAGVAGAYFGQPLIHGNKDAVNIIVTVYSILAGLLVAPGEIHPLLAAVAVLCIAVGSGAAGAINMWYDRDIDLVMARTKNRPIPSGKMNPDEA